MEQKNLEFAKVGLLALIAIFMGINTFSGGGGSDDDDADAFSTDNKFANPHEGHNHANNSNNPFGNQNNSQLSAEDAAKNANMPPPGPTTSIQFAEMSHDFGKVDQDTENKYNFKFTNTGDEPLIITSATGSCGCTVPEYPKEPIPPGGTSEIKVVYSPGKQENQQHKEVTLVANTDPASTVLKISAFVNPGTGSADVKQLPTDGSPISIGGN